MRSGFKKGEVLADTNVRASVPERLCEDSDDIIYSVLEVYAPKAGDGVTGNTEAVWIGGEGTSADPDREAGVDLHPGDSYAFPSVRLFDVWLAVTTDGDKVTWIGYEE